ncbi:hypothetical protein C8A00DRAFT_29368 [Chaetomidium leptoderma]|uniref:Uncharacterized protein n=1 Tax=Chaetomidium leptoderma TaxID=669021 RepID=A0AAN6VUR0_9PEZI|nr:hypothetical protein C8A00DRAFT_29368 [Chaetomidium leptoderma]
MREQHHAAARSGGNPLRERGVPGLRAPPGFAGEGPAAPTTEEEPSSDPSPGAFGVFPFPAARSSSRSPSSATSSTSSSSSTRPEVSSEHTNREKMEATNAYFFGHHHKQVVALMNTKFQDLLGYDKTKNQKILHIDWIAGNPADPVKEGSEPAAHGGMSAEDRRLSESVARSVMRITHGVNQWDETQTWNKSMFFGDWLNDHKGFRQFFFEIQIKRISGDNEELLQQCGISPELVWLSLHDDKAPAVTPIVVPPIVTTQAGPSQVTPRALPTPGQAAVCETIPEVEEEELAAPASESSMQVPTSSADKGKAKAIAPEGQANDASDAAPVAVSSEPVQSPQTRTPLPNIGDLALRRQDAAADASSASADPSVPRTGIPRSQPLPASGSFDSLEPPESETSATTDEAYVEEEDTIYLADDADPFATLIPAHQTPAISAADLQRHRQEFDRNAQEKRAELERIFSFMKDPAFAARRDKSFIYTVRIVAIPDRGNVVNNFTGPRVEDRYGTHIAQGGWIVPPLEERIQWRNEHKRAYRNKGAKLGKYEGLPRPQVQNAMPIKFDWSNGIEPRYFGPPAPVWRELCDPCLEDIYWMVWQLMAGKQFIGFLPGAGFGLPRRDAAGDGELLSQCPFKSPSTEALHHAASYPRGKEQ